MKKTLARLLSCALAMLLSCSVLPLPAAAAEDVSQWSNDKFAYQDYATLYDDYYHLRTVSDGRRGVSWPEGAQVIFGESSYAHTDVEIHEDTSVTSIKFPKSTVILGMYALNHRHQVTSVNFDELTNLRYIGPYAFYDVQEWNVDLRNTQVAAIDLGAFSAINYQRVGAFYAPPTLKRIGASAFDGQRNLSTVVLNEGLEIIEEQAFASGSYDRVVIPWSVKEIGQNALRTDKTYRIYSGSYGETWCKANGVKYEMLTPMTTPDNPYLYHGKGVKKILDETSTLEKLEATQKPTTYQSLMFIYCVKPGSGYDQWFEKYHIDHCHWDDDFTTGGATPGTPDVPAPETPLPTLPGGMEFPISVYPDPQNPDKYLNRHVTISNVLESDYSPDISSVEFHVRMQAGGVLRVDHDEGYILWKTSVGTIAYVPDDEPPTLSYDGLQVTVDATEVQGNDPYICNNYYGRGYTWRFNTPGQYTVLAGTLKGAVTFHLNVTGAAVSLEPSSWAKADIEAAKNANLVPTLTDLPRYQDNITREQFAELIVQVVTTACGEEIDVSNAPHFTDTYNGRVTDAAAAGIVSGVGNDLFAPKQTTNREQIATMIYRAITYIEAQTGKSVAAKNADLSKFTDKGSVSSWAVDSMGALANSGIMKGTSDTTLSPKSPCTVEQAILLVYRLYQQTQN